MILLYVVETLLTTMLIVFLWVMSISILMDRPWLYVLTLGRYRRKLAEVKAEIDEKELEAAIQRLRDELNTKEGEKNGTVQGGNS